MFVEKSDKGQIRHTTRPCISPLGTGPKFQESVEFVRLSPSNHTEPFGTYNQKEKVTNTAQRWGGHIDFFIQCARQCHLSIFE